MSEILLSVLIPTIAERQGKYFPEIVAELERQCGDLPVEILAFYDNRQRTVGEKRNALLREARGKFIVYIDDDDWVEEDYLSTLVRTIVDNPYAEVIVYEAICTRPNCTPLHCTYGIEFDYTKHVHRRTAKWTGKPAHTMPWRRDLVQSVQFPDANFCEDTDWVKRAVAKVDIKNQIRIDKVLYHYRFDPSVSKTRNTKPRKHTLPPFEHLKKCSVVMATRNKPHELNRVLASIFRQKPGFEYEVIVVEDGNEYDETFMVCNRYITEGWPLRYFQLENRVYRNPSVARNYGYKLARGEVIVAQSDDVIHVTEDTMQRLTDIAYGTFNIATVHALTPEGKPNGVYTGIRSPRPLFFLGAMLREHCYAIGGNSEDFTEPGYEDAWFGDCLMHGLKLQPVYRQDVIGHHQHHERPPLKEPYNRMKAVYDRKLKLARIGKRPWTGGNPWPLTMNHGR